MDATQLGRHWLIGSVSYLGQIPSNENQMKKLLVSNPSTRYIYSAVWDKIFVLTCHVLEFQAKISHILF